MKRLFLLAFLSATIFQSCQNAENNSHEGHNGHDKNQQPLTQADSLYKEVMDAHDAVMPKMGKVRGAQKKALQLVDSISSLSPQLLKINQPLKKELEQLVSDLNYADYAMDQWMTEFNLDSGANNPAIRIQYLASEKEKVLKVKAAILNSLAKADSLLNK